MTSDLRPVDMHTTIPDALRREIDDDLAAGGERARKWRPRVTCGATRILALDGPYAGRVGTPTGLAGWTFDRTAEGFSRIFVSADGGSPWRYGLDNRPPQHPVTARAYIGTVDRTPGMDLQAANPRPVPGSRILVPDTPGHFPQTVGQIATILDAEDHPHANRWLPATLTGAPGDVFFVGAWALLPQSDAPSERET